MALTNVWIASFFGPPPAVIGATPVWIAPNDGTVPSAVQSVIAGYFTAVAGASPVWIAGFFAPPPAAIGATPIYISGWSGAVLVIPGSPVNTVAPVASGTLTVGSTLSCTTGTWTNSPTYTYQWQRGGANISGATSSTYVTVSADGGTSVGCLVTATNASGSASQASNTLAIAGGVTSVWSAADAAANGMTLSNGGLTVTPSGAASWQSIRSSTSKTSGAVYVEFANSVANGNSLVFGLASSSFVITSFLGSSAYSAGMAANGAGTLVSAGFTLNYTMPVQSLNSTDVWAIAVDFSAGRVWLAQNNVWLNSGNPATGVGSIASFVPATVGALFAGMSFNGAGTGVWTLQPTAASQKYAPPSGFSAWDSAAPPPTSVWSASDAAANGFTLTNGNLTYANNAVVNKTIRGTVSHTSSKVYVEFIAVATGGNYIVGVASSGFNSAGQIGASTYSGGFSYGSNHVSSGFTSALTNTLYATGPGHVVGIAVDFAAGNIWYAVDNVWANSSNPATGTSPAITFVPATVGALFPAFQEENAGESWTLQPTAASQKYAPPSGFSAWDGGAAHSAQALAYLARTVGGNEGGNGANIANLIDGLVADGVWAKLDALYVLAQQNQTDALLNLVGTSYTATIGGSTPFAAYQGFTGGAGIIDTGFNPATATSPNFTQNSASMGVWVLNSRASGAAYYEIGNNTGVAGAGISPFYNSGGSQTPLNDLTYPAYSGVTNAQGAWSLDRSASASSVYYKNGASVATMAASSTGVASTNVWILGLNNSGTTLDPTSDQVAEAHIGASLGSAGQLALYTRLRTYMTAVGVP